MYPDFEKIDYEVIGGFVVMELTLNHVVIMCKEVEDLVIFKDPKNQSKSKLIISHIFPASLAQRSRVFEVGNLIKSINEEPVSNLADLRKALNKSLKTGNLTIRTKQDVFAVFPFNKVLEQESQLSLIYRYQITDTVQKLIKLSQALPKSVTKSQDLTTDIIVGSSDKNSDQTITVKPDQDQLQSDLIAEEMVVV
jgi:hypothetical protein